MPDDLKSLAALRNHLHSNSRSVGDCRLPRWQEALGGRVRAASLGCNKRQVRSRSSRLKFRGQAVVVGPGYLGPAQCLSALALVLGVPME